MFTVLIMAISKSSCEAVRVEHFNSLAEAEQFAGNQSGQFISAHCHLDCMVLPGALDLDQAICEMLD